MNIKELAEQYACHTETMTGVETEYIFDLEDLQSFAELVAAAEREACAKVADEMSEDVMRFECWQTHALELCAAAIRARGDKHE